MAAAGQGAALRGRNGGISLTNLATEFLLDELRKRQEDLPKPKCGSEKISNYNTPLHVFALFLILIISTLACAFPILARRFPTLPIPRNFLFLSKHFGTGVLIATAFVHLLPTAFISLTDPCLPSFWNNGYPAMAGLIAMTSVFFVMSIEMFFAIKGAGHVHGNEWDMLAEDDEDRRPSLRGGESAHYGQESDRPYSMRMQPIDGSAERLVKSKPTQPQPNGSGYYHDEEREDSDTDLDVEDLDSAATPTEPSHSVRPHLHHNNHSTMHVDTSNPQKQLLQCLLLEAGILFHSVFIGMSLSVTTGPAFVVLLIAISFHQTFEGFALGSRIAALIPALFEPSSPKPWLMALAYGSTTPIGQALGLWLHELYDPASATGLITVGITNAVSSGLLLFAGLVELLAEDFLSDKSYQILRGRRRIQACFSVAAGGALMALVGVWA